MKRRHAERAARGFTLLEVLVALVVLAVALAALMRTASQQASTFQAVRERALAGWVADNALAEVRLQPGLPALGRSDGVARMANRRWPWRLQVSATQAGAIRRVEVLVYAPGSDPNRGATPVQVRDGFVGGGLP